MQKRNKIILAIILIILIVPIAFFTITNLEEQNFYNSIKEISDIENQTDAKGDVIRNKTTPTNDEIREYTIESINTTSTEILMLQDLKQHVFTDSYKEFIDIQINRLNAENRTYTAMVESSDIYSQYKNGEIGLSRTLSLINDKNKEIESYADKTSQYKIEADSFLSIHTDMKDKFDELGIDEDFQYDQIEEVKATYVK